MPTQTEFQSLNVRPIKQEEERPIPDLPDTAELG